MGGQRFAAFVNRFDQRVAEFLVLKIRPHSFDNTLPEFFAAFLVNRLVTDDCEFVRAWRYEK